MDKDIEQKINAEMSDDVKDRLDEEFKSNVFKINNTTYHTYDTFLSDSQELKKLDKLLYEITKNKSFNDALSFLASFVVAHKNDLFIIDFLKAYVLYLKMDCFNETNRIKSGDVFQQVNKRGMYENLTYMSSLVVRSSLLQSLIIIIKNLDKDVLKKDDDVLLTYILDALNENTKQNNRLWKNIIVNLQDHNYNFNTIKSVYNFANSNFKMLYKNNDTLIDFYKQYGAVALNKLFLQVANYCAFLNEHTNLTLQDKYKLENYFTQLLTNNENYVLNDKDVLFKALNDVLKNQDLTIKAKSRTLN